MVACDADGRLTLFNRAAREFHGLDVADVAMADWASHYHLYHADGKTPLGPEQLPLVRALRGEQRAGRADDHRRPTARRRAACWPAAAR